MLICMYVIIHIYHMLCISIHTRHTYTHIYYICVCRSETKTNLVVRIGEQLVNVKCFDKVITAQLKNGREREGDRAKQNELIYCHIGNRRDTKNITER